LSGYARSRCKSSQRFPDLLDETDLFAARRKGTEGDRVREDRAGKGKKGGK